MNIDNSTNSIIFNPNKAPWSASQTPVSKGVNPVLTLDSNGKHILLPRFSSDEMKIAQIMNKIAIHQAKNGIPVDYPDASVEDLKRLTDMSFEASNQRAVYTKPETGEIFNLLNDGKTENGLVKIRVLNEKGGFVKNIEVKPKKIIILDNFDKDAKPERGTYTDQYVPMSHGHYVKTAAMRVNPFADYEYINVSLNRTVLDNKKINEALADLQTRIDAGEDIEFLSFSFGRDVNIDDIQKAYEWLNKEYGVSPEETKATDFLLNCDKIQKNYRQIFEQKNKDKVRIFQAAGNAGKNVLSFDLFYPNVEGVGALGPNGKISPISSSRNSLYTQHYEIGVSRYTPTPYGLSFTNGRTTDVPLRPELQELVKKYLGKPPIKTTVEENKELYRLQKAVRADIDEQREKIEEQVVTQEEKELSAKLNKMYIDAVKAKDKDKIQRIKNSQIDLDKNISDKITPILEQYTSPVIEEYKQFIQKIESEGKLFSKFAGEYYLPHDNPFNYRYKLEFAQGMDGNLVLAKPHTDSGALVGTSFSTPVRTAKVALHEMLKDYL